MNTRMIATGIAGTLALALGATLVGPAQAAPPPYPDATFTVSPTSAYLRGLAGSGPITVRFTAKVTSLTEGAFVDSIDTGVRGPGSSPTSIEELSPVTAVGDSYGLRYYQPGTFTPRAFVTDAAGETTLVALTPVTVLKDATAPATQLTLPAVGNRNRIAAWRLLRGQVADPETGVYDVKLRVLQRRAGVWWVWSSANERWRKGTRNGAWTLAHIKPAQDAATLNGSSWSQPRISGLTKGLLVVRATVRNRGGNVAELQLARQYLSRR
jgi:hypothetical protein